MHHHPEPSASRELLPVLADLPGHLIWRAHARVTMLIASVLPPHVDVHAHSVLQALVEAGAPRSQQAIADTITVSRTTVATVAADLTAGGLVERIRNPADRRSYLLTPTSAGLAVLPEWEQHITALTGATTAPFTATEAAELSSLLLAIARPWLAPDTPPRLLGSMGFLIAKLHVRMHRDLLERLEPLGIEPRHFGVLVALRSLGPVPQAQLARSMGISAASIVQIVDDLSTRGLLERRSAPGDRRTHLLHLLPDADRVLAAAKPLVATVLERWLGPLGPDERDRLVMLLRLFVTAPIPGG